MASFKVGDYVQVKEGIAITMSVKNCLGVVTTEAGGTFGCIVKLIDHDKEVRSTYFYMYELQPYTLKIEDIPLGLLHGLI